MLKKTVITTPKKKKTATTTTTKQQQQQQQKQQLSHSPSYAIIEVTIRHNIAQMTFTSKAYIPCLLATIIK